MSFRDSFEYNPKKECISQQAKLFASINFNESRYALLFTKKGRLQKKQIHCRIT